MRVLLDHRVDLRLKRFLLGHEIRTVREMGWESLTNGELLAAAAREFDGLLTVDQGISHHHNLTTLPIAVVVILALNNRLDTLIRYLPRIEECLLRIAAGQLIQIRE